MTGVGERTYESTVNKDKLDTSALDGLCGLAALHVAVGHYFMFSEPGLDLPAGQAMGLLYILSGLVMYVGYAQKLLAAPTDSVIFVHPKPTIGITGGVRMICATTAVLRSTITPSIPIRWK